MTSFQVSGKMSSGTYEKLYFRKHSLLHGQTSAASNVTEVFFKMSDTTVTKNEKTNEHVTYFNLKKKMAEIIFPLCLQNNILPLDQHYKK